MTSSRRDTTGAEAHASAGAAPIADAGAAGALGAVGALTQRLEELELQQLAFIQSDIQHLRELAVLNRMADALGQRRAFQQVLRDTAAETAGVIGEGARVWVIEPNAAGKILTIHNAAGSALTPAELPLEVRDLFDRVVAEKSDEPMAMPPYDPDAPEGMFLALGIKTAKHLMGVLVLWGNDPGKLNDSHQTRLLRSMLHQTAVACENARLFETLSSMIVDVVIAMALAIESRDPYTGGHVMRVTAYSLLLAQQAGASRDDLSILRLGGLLHDIGKVAVPDAILRKPGKLDNDEFAIMKTHAAVGHQIISPIPQLAAVAPVVRHHHERYDGKGYPDGLAGEAIPWVARICAIADTFDAMTSDRPYRKGMDMRVALEEIARCAGTQFDPELAKVFVKNEPARFAEAHELLRQWREGADRADTLGLIELLEMNLPRLK